MRRVKIIFYLHILIAFYSISGVFSKFAGREEWFSQRFFLFYFGIVFILGIYAIAWQQFIKRMELSLAFANKAATVAWGIIWGHFLFDESIKVTQLVGAIILIFGIILYSLEERERD